MCCMLFSEEVERKRLLELTFFDRQTGETIQASRFIVFQYLYARRTLEVGLTIVMFVMGIALSCFLGYHVYITSIGQTTNENGKWGDIRSWYKKQRLKYKAAVRDGKVPKNPSSNNGNEENDETDIDVYEEGQEHFVDPGPLPKNLYNRGFVENWKEVFFPPSLRKDALSKGGYTAASLKRQQAERQQPKPSDKMERCDATEESPSASSSMRSNKPKYI